MLIYSMSVSVDGFIADREGAFGWSAPSEGLFRFHTASVGDLGFEREVRVTWLWNDTSHISPPPLAVEH